MDWVEIQQQWPQWMDQVRRQWSELTDEDLERIAGRQGELVERIRAVYGISQEEAQRAVSDFARSVEPAERPAQPRPAKLLFNEHIRGIKVIAADGRYVGEVGDLLVNSGSWAVTSVQIKLDKDVADQLGVPRGRFHAAIVNLPVGMIQSVGDSVILSVSSEGLRPTLRAYENAA